MTGLFVRYEMVKAMSATESLLFVVGRMFGKAEDEPQDIDSVQDMMAFARALNG